MPPYERAQFESDLGRIWHRHLGDRGEAERAYQRALALDGEFPPALEGLSELCSRRGGSTKGHGSSSDSRVRLRGPERAPFWLALGRLHAGVIRGSRTRAQLLRRRPRRRSAADRGRRMVTPARDRGGGLGDRREPARAPLRSRRRRPPSRLDRRRGEPDPSPPAPFAAERPRLARTCERARGGRGRGAAGPRRRRARGGERRGPRRRPRASVQEGRGAAAAAPVRRARRDPRAPRPSRRGPRRPRALAGR